MGFRHSLRRNSRCGGQTKSATAKDARRKWKKRIVRVNPPFGEVELEADPRHVTEFPRLCNWKKCKPAATPRHWLDDIKVDRIPSTPLWDREASLKCRSGNMGAAHLAVVDRPNISKTFE